MKYATYLGYSDCHAYEVVRVVSDKTLEIRRLNAVKDPSFVPEFVTGGFCAHCTNQHDQKWIFSSDETNPIIRIRKRKNSDFWGTGSMKFRLDDQPFEFYDYNF